MNPWTTVHRRTVLAHSPHLAVESHCVQLPSGQIVPDWAWIVTPETINVLAVTPDGEYLCVHRTPYAVGGASLAPIDGRLDPGEAPLQAAQRALLQTIGYCADRWQLLGQYCMDANQGMGSGSVYLAMDAYFVGVSAADPQSAQPVVRLRRTELTAALLAGDFKVLAWVTTVALALLQPSAAPQGEPTTAQGSGVTEDVGTLPEVQDVCAPGIQAGIASSP